MKFLVGILLVAACSGCSGEPPPAGPAAAAASREAPGDMAYQATVEECLRSRHFEHCVDQAYEEQAPPCDPTLEPIPLVRFEAQRPSEVDPGVVGWVELEASVGPAGAPQRPHVVSAEPPGVFDAVSIRTFQRWRYCARAHQGKPVRVRFEFGPVPGA